MKGDYTRLRFDPHRRYTSVRWQQGRVQLDADSNEETAVEEHLRKVEAICAILEADREKIDDALIEHYFDPAVVIEEAFDAVPVRWTGHEGASAWVAGNVAEATNAETVVLEALGSGAQSGGGVLVCVGGSGQRAIIFELRDDRFVRIRVFAKAVPALAAAGLADLELTRDEDGRTTISFGDGRRGVAPGRGAIVSARYRYGSGAAGNVDANTVSVVAARPDAAGVDSEDCDRRTLGYVPRWIPHVAAAGFLAANWRREKRKGEAHDLAIALVEILGVVGDIVSYYQEHTAGEAYLSTPRIRRSVRGLSRLVDYRPRPVARRPLRCKRRRAPG